MLGVLAALAKEPDHAMLHAFTAGLAPAVLTDVVICILRALPPRDVVLGHDAAAPLTGMAALAGLMQVRGMPLHGKLKTYSSMRWHAIAGKTILGHTACSHGLSFRLQTEVYSD